MLLPASEPKSASPSGLVVVSVNTSPRSVAMLMSPAAGTRGICCALLALLDDHKGRRFDRRAVAKSDEFHAADHGQ